MQGFQLYLTPAGYRALDNPIMIDIAEAVESGFGTFSEVMEHTGRPKSTVSTYMKKLLESGIIDEDKRNTQCARRVFRINGIKAVELLREGDRSLEFDITKIDRRMLFDAYFFWFLHGSAKRSGISLTSRAKWMMHDLGHHGFKLHNPATFEEAVNNLGRFLEGAYLAKLTLVSPLPMTFSVEYRQDLKLEHRIYMTDLVAVLCASYLENVPSFDTDLKPVVIDGENGLFRLNMVERSERMIPPIPADDTTDFTIYWTGGSYAVITKPTENLMLRILAEGERTVPEILKGIDIPISTAMDIIGRLTASGLITSHDVHGTDVYVLSSALVFDGVRNVTIREEDVEMHLSRVWIDPAHAIRHLRMYEYASYGYLGFDLMKLLNVANSEFADMLCRMADKGEIPNVLDFIRENASEWFCADLGIVSTHPLNITVVRNFEQSEREAHFTLDLFESLFCRIMHNITGMPHMLSASRIYMDNRAINLQFSVKRGSNKKVGFLPPPLLT